MSDVSRSRDALCAASRTVVCLLSLIRIALCISIKSIKLHGITTRYKVSGLVFVCLRLSVCRVSRCVTFVRPTHSNELFGNIFAPMDSLGIVDADLSVDHRVSGVVSKL